MKVFIGSDYRGFELKKALMEFLNSRGFETIDKGAYEYNEGDDFNDPAIAVAKAVKNEPDTMGILVCDSAHGVTMQANRFKRIRAANCDSVESAKLAREHDNANVLCLSAHFVDAEKMRDIVEAFLDTNFVNLERRIRRIGRLDEGVNYD